MPKCSYSTVMNLPVATVWEFVQDMNHWAPMLTGYQAHEILDDRHSKWTLKGDMGVLSRTVHFDVTITEWSGPERVRFELEGVNEDVRGGGEFTMTPADPDTLRAASATLPPKVGLWRRLLNWLARWMFKRKFGGVERKQLVAHEIGSEAAKLTFSLEMNAGGPQGPMVNAMLEPLMLPATEDLANKIAAHLENAARTR